MILGSRTEAIDEDYERELAVESCPRSIETTYKDNLGSYGNMFDIMTDQKIELFGIDIYTDAIKDVFYEVYTKPISFTDEADEAKWKMSGWTLLKAGVVRGKGVGEGTPIRDFPGGNMIIEAGKTTGFYVTLNTTDLRYRNVQTDIPFISVGDRFVFNEDLQVLVGVSVGGYPLTESTTYFGKRGWSGALHYTSDLPCPALTHITEEPSVSTTSIPDLKALTGTDCLQNRVLLTNYDGGTGAYGSMFTVTAKEEPISITSLSFHTDNSAGNVTAIVYTKGGNFVGYEHDYSVWRKISKSTLQGSGAGHGSMIEPDNFESVLLFPHETISFYITLTTADIRYGRDENAILGKPVASNDFLDLNAGVGLADYPFATEFFIYSPRIFNGMVHFRTGSSCLPEQNITYIFNINHPSDVAESQLLKFVTNRFEEITRMLVLSDTELHLLHLEHNMTINTAFAEKRDGVCAQRRYKYLCTPVDVTLSLRHAATLTGGKLKYTWRSLYKNITRGINSLFDTQHVGYVPVETGLKILLSSESTPRKMTNNTTKAFQQAAFEFLQDKLVEQNIAVLGLEVTQQSVTGNTHHLQAEDDDTVASTLTSSLEIFSSILGEYRPPPEVDFSGVVEDAIDADVDDFEEAIRRSDEFFELYNSIEIDVVSPNSLVLSRAPGERKQSTKTAMTLTIVLAVAITGFLLLLLGFFFYKKKSKEQEKFNDTFFQESSVLKEGKRNITSLFFPSAAQSTIRGTIVDDDMFAVQWTDNDRQAVSFHDDRRTERDGDNFDKGYEDEENDEIMDAHVTQASTGYSTQAHGNFNPNAPSYF